MPLYNFDVEYRVRASVTVELDSDEDAKAYGWAQGEANLTDPFDIQSIDFDDQDVDIHEVNEDGTKLRALWED
jgi:hypothetical protein